MERLWACSVWLSRVDIVKELHEVARDYARFSSGMCTLLSGNNHVIARCEM